GDLLADRVGHLLDHRLLLDGGAGDLLTVAGVLPDLALADLVGALLANADPLGLGLLGLGAAVARIRARITAVAAALRAGRRRASARGTARSRALLHADLLPDRLGLAGHTVLLGLVVTTLLGHGLAGGDRHADRLADVLVAGLLDRVVAGGADVLVD